MTLITITYNYSVIAKIAAIFLGRELTQKSLLIQAGFLYINLARHQLRKVHLP